MTFHYNTKVLINIWGYFRYWITDLGVIFHFHVQMHYTKNKLLFKLSRLHKNHKPLCNKRNTRSLIIIICYRYSLHCKLLWLCCFHLCLDYPSKQSNFTILNHPQTHAGEHTRLFKGCQGTSHHLSRPIESRSTTSNTKPQPKYKRAKRHRAWFTAIYPISSWVTARAELPQFSEHKVTQWWICDHKVRCELLWSGNGRCFGAI